MTTDNRNAVQNRRPGCDRTDGRGLKSEARIECILKPLDLILGADRDDIEAAG